VKRHSRVSLVVAGALCALLLPSVSGSTGSAKSGGIFRVTFLTTPGNFDRVDPARAYSRESWALLDTVCARLMRYRDRPPPQGYQLVPEVAATPPVVSRDGRTWTFGLRSGFRFSDGSPVRADAFAQAIYRTMAPGVDSAAYQYTRAIVGAEDVRAGRARRPAGVTWSGNTLTVRFTREVREFDAWTTMPFFCAVPPTLPPSPEGVRTFPGAGPYTIREYRPYQRIVLGRNRYYGGNRAHHVDGFHVDLSAGSPDEKLERVVAGRADWTYTLPAIALQPSHGVIKRFGVNYARFFLDPGLTVSMYVLNSSGPLFRNNPQLRRAVNLALNKERSLPFGAGVVTDQYLAPTVQGFKQRTIYPPQGDLARARALASGNLRGGKALLYVPDVPAVRRGAQFVKQQLEELGLEIEIRPFGEHATASSYLGRLGPDADEPWDLGLVLWTPDFVDPAAYINRLLDGQHAGGTNLARFDEPPYNALMQQASRLQGAARAKAYAELDLRLARDAAPLLPIAVLNEVTLVSARVGCMLRRPGLVLTTVCLKR
jgi:ABC-type oligopeptide transport system substrate-binding subunit